MSARGWDDPAFEPAPYQPDPDLEYELRMAAIDRGERCVTRGCVAQPNDITRETNIGLPCFHCTRCRARWYDAVTQPTPEAA